MSSDLLEAGKQEEEYQLNTEEIDEPFLLFKVHTYSHKQHLSGNASSLTQLEISTHQKSEKAIMDLDSRKQKKLPCVSSTSTIKTSSFPPPNH